MLGHVEQKQQLTVIRHSPAARQGNLKLDVTTLARDMRVLLPLLYFRSWGTASSLPTEREREEVKRRRTNAGVFWTYVKHCPFLEALFVR